MSANINVGNNIETYIYLSVFLIGSILLYLFLRINWKSYGLLFILATVIGNLLCFIFVQLGFYSYPYVILPKFENMPYTAISLSFPIYVLILVRYSPKRWPWKIPFYWAFINLGLLSEYYALHYTSIIKYGFEWDTWDSYTWWWIYFLLFEWIGGQLIPDKDRKPLHIKHLHYGKLGWGLIHLILITTIFLAGYYVGTLTKK
ncbi:CBO0543 family protein [Litchfieldia alkalitelluris]|uniref:CBO0543 family protein n=1 Tax=Litchfieldia alkalitelluris TaxID=304268 RepID=UPI0009963ABC|nr:CBO0543 family protein [Litchfieldia alkalitelluris]